MILSVSSPDMKRLMMISWSQSMGFAYSCMRTVFISLNMFPKVKTKSETERWSALLIVRAFMVFWLFCLRRFILSSRQQMKGTIVKNVQEFMRRMFWSFKLSQVQLESGKNQASMQMSPLMRGQVLSFLRRFPMVQRTVAPPYECPTKKTLLSLIYLLSLKTLFRRSFQKIQAKTISISLALISRSLFRLWQRSFSRVSNSVRRFFGNSTRMRSLLCWMETTIQPWEAHQPQSALQLLRLEPRPWLKTIRFQVSSFSKSLTQKEASPRTGIFILKRKDMRKLNILKGMRVSKGFTQAISQRAQLQLYEGIHLACSPSAMEGQKIEISYSFSLMYLYPELYGPLPTIQIWQNFKQTTKMPRTTMKMVWKISRSKQSAAATRKKIGVYGLAPSQMQLTMETKATTAQKYCL